MGLKVTYLSVAMTIAGNPVVLESAPIPDLDKVEALPEKTGNDKAGGAIQKKLAESLAFSMKPGQSFKCTLGGLVEWFKGIVNTFNSSAAPTEKLDESKIAVPEVFGTMTGKNKTQDILNGIEIEIWNLSFSTTLDFSVNVRVNLTPGFYDALGIPKAVQNIFTLDSLAIGVVYSKDKKQA